MIPTTLAQGWDKFAETELQGADVATRRKAHWAFWSGAQMCLMLTAETLGKFRDEINEMEPITAEEKE